MRTIRKSSTASANEAFDLVASLLAVELIKPSRCLWVISPWVSNVQILDNRLDDFTALESYAGRRVGFAEVLTELAVRGTRIVVATRDEPSNRFFRGDLERLAKDRRVQDSVTICVVPDRQALHDKALTGDDFVVAGSMNFTYNGLHMNEEQIQFHDDPGYVAETQRDLHQRFGGVLQ